METIRLVLDVPTGVVRAVQPLLLWLSTAKAPPPGLALGNVMCVGWASCGEDGPVLNGWGAVGMHGSEDPAGLDETLHRLKHMYQATGASCRMLASKADLLAMTELERHQLSDAHCERLVANLRRCMTGEKHVEDRPDPGPAQPE